MRGAALTFICVAICATARASPDPPLPWESSSFTVRLDSGTIEFELDCPGGKLTRLSARRGEQVAEAPIERLAALSLPDSCSGVTTRAARESEGSSEIVGVELTVELSREYIREELLIFFDVRSFAFTAARKLLTYPGEETQVTRAQLRG